MNLTVIGARGMLGSDLVTLAREAGWHTTALDLPQVDIAAPEGIRGRIPDADWLVNCAAYTDVDGAETDAQTALAVNAEGPRRLAELCAARGMPLLHISTDYVFDGTSSRPYTEDDPTAPVNRYGETKLAGEQAVQASGCRGLIVRTQSLFGPGDRHFVAAIVRQLAKPDPALRVVSDQVSCPTYTRDAAAAILNLLRLHSEGIVHVSSEGACSWHDFARAIAARVRPAAAVTPVPAAGYARRARRPAHSVLDKARYRAWTGERLPHWEQALDAYLARFDAPARA